MLAWLLWRGESRGGARASCRAGRRTWLGGGHGLSQGRGVVSTSPSFKHVRASHQSTFREQASCACPSALQTRPPPALAGTFTAQECCRYCCARPQPTSPRKTPCGERRPSPPPPASRRTDGRTDVCPRPPPEVGLGGWTQLSDTSACRPPPACPSRFKETQRK